MVSASALFWDTSALLPLMVKESFSPVVRKIWAEHDSFHAWDWVLVEVDAALIRRKAGHEIWQDWRNVQKRLCLYSLENKDIQTLRTLNRGIGLRAADAGHLFLFHTLVHSISDMALLTFDREMATAAQRLGLRVHPACIQS